MPPPEPIPPAPPTPTLMPPLPDPDFGRFGHGISLLGGWLPLSIEVLAIVALVVAVGWRSRRWRTVWVPVGLAIGVAAALGARTYMNSEGLASDPAPLRLWLWAAVFAFSIALLLLGFRSARWWRRALSVVAVPLTALAVLVVLNEWVGYYPTWQRAWGDITSGPMPDQTDLADLTALRNTHQVTGKLVPVDIPADASGFKHRREYVYLPPIWFAGQSPPKLPALLMITGEFGNPTNWIRTGNAIATVDDYAKQHGGAAPILVFADSSGSFNNDTECVNGPRGDAADHLTKDVRPYVVSQFGVSPDPADWGIVGWSMGGTCAIDLTVMHPELFSVFDDIGGDRGPNSGTKEQTIKRLYGGNAAQWAAFDPRTVMAAHGPYRGVAGYFDDSKEPADDKSKNVVDPRRNHEAPVGYGGHDEDDEFREKGALPDLCAAAAAQDIGCDLRVYPGYHTWQFAVRAFANALPWLAQRVHTPTT
ncbi:MAG: alpha/beta hydrolase-fold protein [Mycobacterium sp.]